MMFENCRNDGYKQVLVGIEQKKGLGNSSKVSP
jgi:hypothetical protein